MLTKDALVFAAIWVAGVALGYFIVLRLFG
jgi:hypothetical protein